MLYLDILCFLGSVHKGCSIFFCHFLRYLPTSPCPILNCIPKFFLVSIIVAVRWTTSWQWTFVYKRRSERSRAQLAKIVKIRKKIKKNREIDSVILLQQQSNAMTGNDVSLLKNSWNRIRGAYFWQVLAIWSHCGAQETWQKRALNWCLRPF